MRCNSLLKVVCYPVGESSGIIVLKNECPDPIYKVVCNVGEGYDELDFTLTEATSQYAIEINLYDGNHNVVRSFTTSDRNPEISIGGNYRFENVRDVYYASYTFKRRDTVRTC